MTRPAQARFEPAILRSRGGRLNHLANEAVPGRVATRVPVSKSLLWLDRQRVIYTDGSVTGERPGWGFTVKQSGRTVHQDSGVHRVTTSSLTMEVEAITHAIQWIAFHHDVQITQSIILTDTVNLLLKVESRMGCPD